MEAASVHYSSICRQNKQNMLLLYYTEIVPSHLTLEHSIKYYFVAILS